MATRPTARFSASARTATTDPAKVAFLDELIRDAKALAR